MIKVRFFGMLRLELAVSSVELQADTISELLSHIAAMYEKTDINKLRNSVIFINDRNINEMKGFKTKLKEGDEVIFLSPVSGG